MSNFSFFCDQEKKTSKVQHSRLQMLTTSCLHFQSVSNWEKMSNSTTSPDINPDGAGRLGEDFIIYFPDKINLRFKHTNTRCTACGWLLGADFCFNCNYRHFDQNLSVCLLGWAERSGWETSVNFAWRARLGWFFRCSRLKRDF